MSLYCLLYIKVSCLIEVVIMNLNIKKEIRVVVFWYNDCLNLSMGNWEKRDILWIYVILFYVKIEWF